MRGPVRAATVIVCLLSSSTAVAQSSFAVRRLTGEAGSTRLVEEHVTVRLDRQHADTRLRQVHHNLSGARVEGFFRLRVAAGTVVEGFTYFNGDEKIVGEVFERQAARQVYDTVTEQQRDPGILEQDGEGEFSFRVFPIEPDERKRVEVRFSSWAQRRGRTVEYRVPVAGAQSRISIVLTEDRPIEQLRSSTHRLDVATSAPGRYDITARAEGTVEELVLSYDVADAPWTVHARVHRDQGQDAYAVVTLAAPDVPDRAVAPKDVTLVLDRSQSMAGAAIRAAQAAAIDIVERLRGDDRINIVAFNEQVTALSADPRRATDDVKRDAIQFIRNLTAGGGTDIAAALAASLAAQQPAGPRSQAILFLTDGGSPSPPALDVATRDRTGTRVFTIGLGAGVDRAFLSRLAKIRGGRFTYVQSAAELEERVSAVFTQIEQPVLVDVGLSAIGARLSGTYPRTSPDLFRDDEIRFATRLEGGGTVRLFITGFFDGRQVRHEVRLRVGPQEHRPWVARLWAKDRVDDLLEEIALVGEDRELVDETVNLAMAYDFVTPYTAFLAIPESELVGAVGEQVANLRDRRRQVLQQYPGALALSGGAPATPPVTVTPNQPMTQATPEPPVDRELEESARFEADGDDEAAEPEMVATGAAPDASQAGCQSCAAGSGGGRPLGALVPLLAVLSLLLRRRRRR